MICRVWVKNSISRMPPGESFTSRPSSAVSCSPLCSRIRRRMSCASWIAAKSRCLRQMNGRSRSMKPVPASMAPAQGRALIQAARSQVRPIAS